MDVLYNAVVLSDSALEIVVMSRQVAVDEAEGDAVDAQADHGGSFEADVTADAEADKLQE